MPSRSQKLQLNIRQKIVVGFIASILIIGTIALLSYHYLRAIELKQHVAELANDLRETILEIRRYEKNYLLYGSHEDLHENLRYSQLALENLEEIVSESKHLRVASQLDLLNKELLAYQRVMQLIDDTPNPLRGRQGRVVTPAQEEELREKGKSLVELSQQLVKFERDRILDIINSLKTQLLISTVLFVISGIGLTMIVSRKIVRPLKVIENTTLRIARGDFRPLPVLATRDETQQVVEAFNRMVAELERRQDQLVQSKKMSSIGILTAGVAHQLNNPLNNISTSCQIALEELAQGDQQLLRRMLGHIEQEVHRARDIVKGLLEFSRARDFALQPTHLAEVVKRSLKLISSQVPPGIDIINEVPEDLILDLDAQRMQEVFLNLLMNAIQAITETPGQIRITAQVADDRRHAVISVADTGEGIPTETLDSIFDPFFSTKEVGLGTGLGLSIAYGIIQKHRGTISARSAPGEGARIDIRLPLHVQPTPDPEAL